MKNVQHTAIDLSARAAALGRPSLWIDAVYADPFNFTVHDNLASLRWALLPRSRRMSAINMAMDLGYDSASAFIYAFRDAMGNSP